MTARFFKLLLGAAFGLIACNAAAYANPQLKAQVDVAGKLVTVGDMFSNAGTLADEPLFRAPAPGTSGFVGIAEIRAATARIDFPPFDDANTKRVRVTRLAKPVDGSLLTGLIARDLKARGVLTDAMTIQVQYDTILAGVNAADVASPVQLVNLHYVPQGEAFAARFTVAGRDAPLDVTGRITTMIEAPQLTSNLPAGTILTASDLVMRPIPLKFANSTGPAPLGQLIGKQLRRQSRAGITLRPSDVREPELISRNDPVTVYLHTGPMMLTVKGTALNSASLGQPVAVLNLMSKKVLHGVARADGAVEIRLGDVTVAGL